MANVQIFVAKPGTPELATCARWRASAFSVLNASFDQELESLELFAADQSRGVALVASGLGAVPAAIVVRLPFLGRHSRF